MSRTKAKRSQDPENEQPRFVSGDALLESVLELPGMRDAVNAGLRANTEMNRAYAENLAAIRKAGQMTQAQVARKLGVGQAAVSRIESRDDLLLSTLSEYLEAAGATDSRIVVMLHGIEIELDLQSLRHARPSE